MKAVIIAGGTPPSKELLLQELDGSSVIISADSGANCLFNYGITPDFLVGDFDSISQNVFESFKINGSEILQFPKDKDFTDTQLALEKAISLGVNQVIFFGCTGSRLDHTLGNIGLLNECLKNSIEGCIVDEKNVIAMADKTFQIKGKRGEFFSLLAFGGPVINLSISGAKYELNNYKLALGNPITLSNEFLDEIVKIEFDDGEMLIIRSRD